MIDLKLKVMQLRVYTQDSPKEGTQQVLWNEVTGIVVTLEHLEFIESNESSYELLNFIPKNVFDIEQERKSQEV